MGTADELINVIGPLLKRRTFLGREVMALVDADDTGEATADVV